MKLKGLRWAGSVSRIEEGRMQKRILMKEQKVDQETESRMVKKMTYANFDYKNGSWLYRIKTCEKR